MDKQEASFMYAQLLKTIIVESNYSDIDKKDMIDFCRVQYANNPRQLKLIDELERDYLSVHSAAWWYTLDSFLYSMLNKALRVLDLDTLFNLRVFIKDLHNQLVNLHMEKTVADMRTFYERIGIGEERMYRMFGTRDPHELYRIRAPAADVMKSVKEGIERLVKPQLNLPPHFNPPLSVNKFTLYRGQQMLTSDFEKLKANPGGLLSINNFLSTTMNPNLAAIFAGESNDDGHFTAVLFTIETNQNERTEYPYANISEMSAFGLGENETLFSMGTVFRIGQSEQISDKLWRVYLSLTIDRDPQLSQLTTNMKRPIQNTNPLCRFGKLAVMLGQYTKAEQFYKDALNLEVDERQQASIHYELGSIYIELGVIDLAMDHYQQSLEIERVFVVTDDNNPSLPRLYGSIGRVYCRQGCIDLAQEYFMQALDLLSKISSNSRYHYIALFSEELGSMLRNEGHLEEAIKWHENALIIRTSTLPSMHPNIATSVNHCGRLYDATGKYDQALSLYAKVIEMQQLSLPSNHPSMAITYNNMAETLCNLGRYTEALMCSKQAVDIDVKTLGSEHKQTKEHQQTFETIFAKL